MAEGGALVSFFHCMWFVVMVCLGGLDQIAPLSLPPILLYAQVKRSGKDCQLRVLSNAIFKGKQSQ